MKITWCRVPHRTGLARVTQPERGWDIKIDGGRVGGVSAHARAWEENRGYYWCARVTPIDGRKDYMRNTAGMDKPFDCPQEAARECDAWVRARLGLKPRRKPLMLRGMGT